MSARVIRCQMDDWLANMSACMLLSSIRCTQATEIPTKGTQPAPSIQPEVLTRLVFAGVDLKRQRRILNFLSLFFSILSSRRILRYYELTDPYLKCLRTDITEQMTSSWKLVFFILFRRTAREYTWHPLVKSSGKPLCSSWGPYPDPHQCIWSGLDINLVHVLMIVGETTAPGGNPHKHRLHTERPSHPRIVPRIFLLRGDSAIHQ